MSHITAQSTRHVFAAVLCAARHMELKLRRICSRSPEPTKAYKSARRFRRVYPEL